MPFLLLTSHVLLEAPFLLAVATRCLLDAIILLAVATRCLLDAIILLAVAIRTACWMPVADQLPVGCYNTIGCC